MLFVIDKVPSFTIHFYKNSIADKWQSLMKESFVGDGKDIDHRRSFYHYQKKEHVQNDLIRAIQNINDFLKFDFIKISKPIDWNSTDLYNNLHLCFEKLSGEFDKPTKLFKVAPEHIKESIRDLNYCVHTLEHNNIEEKKSKINLQWTKSRTETKRIKFENHEYETFQFFSKKFEVYLGYNELGKNFVDLWKDNLPIKYKNLKNSHYVGLDISISLKNNTNIFHSDFIQWMTNNNIDPYDKKLGIGLCPIGKCTIHKIDHLTKNSIVSIII